jgi:ATP-dependent Clp protease ATP-binding subunit ClpC
VEKYFRPEFLNRLDEVIVFQSLSKEDLRKIIDIEIRHVTQRLAQQGLHVDLAEDAKDWLIEKGYNPEFGARPLRRAIEQFVEDPLAEEMLRGAFHGKKAMRITVRDDHLYFEAFDVPPAGEEIATGVAVVTEASPKDPQARRSKK